MKVGGIRMKILFVGNSHTYMNDMPEMVRINSSEKLEVTMLARPAITFHDHLESMELQFALNKDMILLFFNRHHMSLVQVKKQHCMMLKH